MWTDTVGLVVTVLVAGVLGGAAMEMALWAVGRAGWAKADMIVALGSLLTRSRQHAWGVGMTVHVLAAITFAALYTFALVKTGFAHVPESVLLAGAIGFFHGLFVSLGLVWVVAEQHPLKEFQEASFAVGLSHVAGHVAYGIVVGLVVGIAAL